MNSQALHITEADRVIGVLTKDGETTIYTHKENPKDQKGLDRYFAVIFDKHEKMILVQEVKRVTQSFSWYEPVRTLLTPRDLELKPS